MKTGLLSGTKIIKKVKPNVKAFARVAKMEKIIVARSKRLFATNIFLFWLRTTVFVFDGPLTDKVSSWFRPKTNPSAAWPIMLFIKLNLFLVYRRKKMIEAMSAAISIKPTTTLFITNTPINKP